MLELGDEHRRHAVDRRAPVRLDRAQRRFGVERFGGNDHRGAVRHRREVAQHAAEAVIERHRHADAVVVGVSQHLADEEAVVQDVVMRERGALREAGRAGRVLDVDRIVELKQRFARCQIGRRARSAVSMNSVQAMAPGGASAPKTITCLQRRQPRGVERNPAGRAQLRRQVEQHPQVVGLAERTRGDEHRHA